MAAQTHAETLIDALVEAYKVATMSVAHSINEGGEKADPYRLQALLDCADLCQAAAAVASRASPYLTPLANLAAEAAQACAKAFADLEHDDPQLRRLYAVTLHAARVCEEFTGRRAPAPVQDERDLAMKASFPASDPPPGPAQGSPSQPTNAPADHG